MGPSMIAVRVYGNLNIKVLGCYQTYYRWEGVKHQALLNITNANKCPTLLSYKTNIRMGLEKFIDQIREKIAEEANSHHFWSIAFQCPIQDQAIMPILDKGTG